MSSLRNCSTNNVKQGVSCIYSALNNSNRQSTSNIDLTSAIQKRAFSRSQIHSKRARNFYDDLGISKNATQSEIKGAYYGLSKIYHPDKNKNNEEAGKRFRKISEAYEVLGNYRTRRMYDKGIGSFGQQEHSPGTASEIVVQEMEEDDAQTKFYKQHMKRHEVPDMAGRMSARDFDSWANTQITKSFQQKQRLKEMVTEHEAEFKSQKFKYDGLGFIICAITFMYIAMSGYEMIAPRFREDHDDKKPKR